RLPVRLVDRERDRDRLSRAHLARRLKAGQMVRAGRLNRRHLRTAATGAARGQREREGEQAERPSLHRRVLPFVGVSSAITTAPAPPTSATAVASRASEAGSDEMTTPCRNTLSEPSPSAAAKTPTIIAAPVCTDRPPTASAAAATTARTAAEPTSIHSD